MFRLPQFLSGIAAGVIATPLVLIAIMLVRVGVESSGSDRAPTNQLTISGSSVSRSGGAAIEVSGLGGWEAECRDTCDDLMVQEALGARHEVRVLNGEGACILCKTRYSADEQKLSVWTLAGDPKLTLTGRAGDAQ